MSTATRERILDTALEILRSGGTVTLDSASRESGLTKPGLMYYFPNKEALMLGLVDHVIERWERALRAALGSDPQHASARDRIRAYVDFALTTDFDETDIIMLADPRLREPLGARWVELLTPWFDLPDDLDAEERGRLTALRLLADGLWFASATQSFEPAEPERAYIRTLAEQLLGD
ncbi:TetR/AcrR family transcriptional regulator [Agromyces atrinae]|uniref:TetR/AcrR family transcriptional regulator n=1 Tax=Agromyces atrinae TaxID=592376 RepID=UPI001F570FDC|nr:TetR/AcrR family transcriptional regulator [Agromyces atrinae]MCI2957133.1 TetR/AcrR family transcriptional regulator [Agromyces atrinae]